MNQKLWKERLETIFTPEEYEVHENPKDRQRNVYVCRKGNTKRLISIWPNGDLYNVVIKHNVKETLDKSGFKFSEETKGKGTQHDYRRVTETYILNLCRKYVEIVNE